MLDKGLRRSSRRSLDVSAGSRKLVRAYETLKNESERRKYDLIYPSPKGKDASSQYMQEPCSGPVPTSQSETASEAAQIAALQKLKQERAARWRTNNMTFESSIFEIKREIRRLEQDIKDLDSILAAEAAAETQKNSWSTWLLSPVYKKAEDSNEEKARKDRARQERRIEKDMKERRLDANKARLKTTET
jgi:curved DNA-binding protein CbpA